MMDKEFVENTLYKSINSLENYFEENYLLLEEKFIKEFETLCTDLLEVKNIAYINFSYLYTEIVKNSGLCLVSVYDKDWYVGELLYESNIKFDFIFDFLHEFEETLIIESKKYLGKVNILEIKKIKLDVVKIYGYYLAAFIKKVMHKFKYNELFLALNTEKKFAILAGEYMDFAEIIYLLDTTEKISNEVIYDIEKSEAYDYKYIENLELDALDASLKDLKNTIFKNCTFDGADFSRSNLYNSEFVGCSFNETLFWDSLVIGTKFLDCKFTNCKFENINNEFKIDKLILEKVLNDKNEFIRCVFESTSIESVLEYPTIIQE